MPRLRATPQQKRERAILEAIFRYKMDNGVKYDMDIARAMGISKQKYSRLRESNFQNMTFQEFGDMARKLGFTAPEICAAVGIPYERREGV